MARDKGTIVRDDGIIIEGLVDWFLETFGTFLGTHLTKDGIDV